MSTYTQLNLNITDLLLNTSNPRFDPVDHQREAIEEMIKDQQGKLVVLARHIMEFGLNPIDPLLVKPHKGQWVVKEGNRRATALKLVNQPSLIPVTQPELRRAFETLSKQVSSNLLRSIPCIATEDDTLINEWVRLKHTGQNDGAGTVGWDGTQTARFRSMVEGKPDMRLEFLDYLRGLDEIPNDLKARFSQIMKTNFDRLMGDPDVRAHFGLDIREGIMRPVDGVNELLLLALDDLSGGDFSVARIYTKDLRREYIDELIKRAEERWTADNTNRQEYDEKPTNSEDGHSGGEADEAGTVRKGRENEGSYGEDTGGSSTDLGGGSKPKGKKSYPINRKTLVPSFHKLPIDHPRLSKIFAELKTLNVKEFANAVAVLLRTFIELSADYYIGVKGINKVNVDSKLGNKIDAIADDMKAKGIMTDHELRPIRQMTSSPAQTQSVKTFHSYVHNLDVTPLADDLKSAWDDIWRFVENMWR
ncbi:hypothetical protein hamaS1_04500 [Moorella sp. Hama-1]|nr:hypothetical protein hamaS1_04500 [Moorella sp. Hama-1]